MAYNQHREWDRGKEAWDGGAAWNDARSNVRGREDDSYGEGKRRKFNNGGYDNAYAYDDSGYGQGHFQDYSQGERSQRGGAAGHFGGKKRLLPSEPSPHVIFLGLDPTFTEADLQAYLSSNGFSVETVTIIRDKTTGVSKGFGFAQFPATEDAQAFVDPSFPYVQVPPPASHGASATAAFYKALETGLPHTGRRVKIDYSQSAQHDKVRQPRQNLNDGTRDIGNSQSSVLLFRGLDPLSGPQAIHQAMRYSSGPGKEGAKGMKRIILIKDRVTMASFGFGFVEFIDVQSASNVLAATMSSQIHPNGFRISDRPVATSFAHPQSFQPVDPMMRDEAAITSSESLGGAEGGWVRYWDETSTIAVLEFKVEAPAKPAAAATKEKEKKKKAKANDELRDVVVAPSALPLSDKPVTLSFNKGAKIKGAKPLILGVSLGDGEGEDDDDEAKASESSVAEAAKRVAPLIASKKTVNNINKWNQVQEELSQDVGHTSVAPSPAPIPVVSMPLSATTKAALASGHTPMPPDEFEYADKASLACLLCARRFKSLDQLKLHNKDSKLHKGNLENEKLCEEARQKVLAKKQAEEAKDQAKQADQPQYRDRAMERRTLFNQPDAPVLEKEPSAGSSKAPKKRFEGPPPNPSPPPAPVHLGKDNNNVGNKLLKMMGWTEGTGLGTQSDGMVDPIKTAFYAAGAGLGASKPKDITKLTEGYAGYVNMAQDAARERYNS